MSTPHLHVDAITVTYGNTVAVQDITLGVEQGKTTAVIGPSGCGKSTTLNAVVGLVYPSAGNIMLNGKNITHVRPSRRNIGLVPQSYAVFPHLSVRNNIAYGLNARGIKGEAANKIVNNMMELTRLGQYQHRKPAELSGGQRQRVALARALAIDPQALLLDEPLAALDPQLRGELRRELASMLSKAGCGTLIVTHDQHEALALADQIAILRDGRLVQYGTPDELWRKPADAFVADFLANAVLVEVEVADGIVRAFNRQWEIPLDTITVEPDQRTPHLLIRRDSLQFVGPDTPGAMPATVLATEYAGGELLVQVQLGDVKVTVITNTLPDQTKVWLAPVDHKLIIVGEV